MSSRITRPGFLSMLGLLSVFLVSCSNSGEAGFPQIASPPPFDFIDGEDLRSRMHQLAFELQRLDVALMTGESGDTFEQQQIVQTLQNIERIASLIRENELSVRHTFLSDDMAGFISTVSRARKSAESNPPQFYMAGRVSGACVNCHRVNSTL